MADTETTQGEPFDVAVVGLGAMGSAVAFHAAGRGNSVLGIDRYDPPHDLGSSHAETRISRLAVGEGPQYLPFVSRSHEIWRELEERAGVDLLYECGGYIFTEQAAVPGQRWEDFVNETARIAADAGIDYEILQPADVRETHPWINVPDDRNVGFEPTAGLVMAERAIEVQLRLARESGATLHTGEHVTALVPDDDEVTVETEHGSYRAKNVVLATGPWIRQLAAPAHREQLTITRQVVFWFEAEDLGAFAIGQVPFIMWIADSDEDYIAIFPSPPGTTPGVKVMGEQFLEGCDPETVVRDVTQSEIDTFYDTQLAPKVSGITRNCIRAAVCLYTNTADDHFLIDTDPRSDRIVTMSPCSGHGFKHSTALAEAVVERIATGVSTLDLSPFYSS